MFNNSIAMAWSVVSLTSNPAARVGFLAESGILISTWNWCVSFVFCPVLSLTVDLTTDSERHALVFLSSVLVHSLCSPYRHPTHGHLGCKFRGVSPTLERVNVSERKKEIKKRKETNKPIRK